MKLADDASEGWVVPRESLSGRYELLGRLGAGGMAEIFLARATGIDDFEKIVVLKRILSNKRSDPYFAGMLRDEARVAACLSHPNIVQTHDIAIDGDEYFFTMEYLHGETVKKIIYHSRTKGISIPIELVLQIGIGAAAGLHHAHEQTDYAGHPLGIVHRDVSPSNIIVTRQSGVKLIDFGIAKAASGKEVTTVGTVKGKAAYMAPEQCRGTGLDRRSDLFALGIVLYEMITQNKPFDGDNELATLHKLLSTEPTPPTLVRADCPIELEMVVRKAMEKDPEQRYQTVFEMQEELELVMRDLRLHALPGALGRFLAHLFGPKPHPWSQRSANPPPVPRWAWADMDNSITSRRHAAAAAAAAAWPNPTPSRSTAPDARSLQAASTGPTPAPHGASSVNAPAVAPGPPAYSQEVTGIPAPASRRLWVPIATTALVTAGLAGLVAWVAWPGRSPSAHNGVALADPTSAAPTQAPEAPPPEASVGAQPPEAPPPEASISAQPPEGADDVALIEPTTRPPVEPAVVVPPIEENPTEPRAKPSGATTAATQKSRPNSASRKAQAADLLAQAFALYTSNPAKALGLVRRSMHLRKTNEALNLYAALACKQTSLKDAKKAHRALRGSARAEIEKQCRRNGIEL